MTPRLPSARQQQLGISLMGLLFGAIVVAFLGMVAVRVAPTVNEYLTIQKAVDKIAASAPPTVPEIRSAFDRAREIEFAITSIKGQDLEITREGNRAVIAFAYEKEIRLFGPAYLLLKYQGRSK